MNTTLTWDETIRNVEYSEAHKQAGDGPPLITQIRFIRSGSLREGSWETRHGAQYQPFYLKIYAGGRVDTYWPAESVIPHYGIDFIDPDFVDPQRWYFTQQLKEFHPFLYRLLKLKEGVRRFFKF